MAFLRLILICLVLSSCYEEPSTSNITDLIAGSDAFGKTWQVEKIEAEFGIAEPHPCVRDNYITYFPSGKYEINEGASKCDPEDSPAVVGLWYLDETEEFLFVELGDSLQTWQLDFVGAKSQEITAEFEEGHRTYRLVLSR